MVRKKAVRKKKSEAGSIKKKLKGIVGKILTRVSKMKEKQKQSLEKIAVANKKHTSAKDPSKKLSHLFDVEALKIHSFRVLEPDIKAIVPLMNQAYGLSSEVGGKVKSDYQALCKHLNQGFNLALLEKDLKKLNQAL